MVELLTVGHGTAAATELGPALAAAQVRALVDIRIAPGSRRSPHLARDRLSEWLPAYGVDYRWDRRLGGFRKLPSDSPDIALRNTSFRAYAAWMRDCEFATAIDELLAGAAGMRTAVLCSETVWWRCHRRLVADFVTIVRGGTVQHLLAGRLRPHRVTAGARLDPATGLLVYDAVDPCTR